MRGAIVAVGLAVLLAAVPAGCRKRQPAAEEYEDDEPEPTAKAGGGNMKSGLRVGVPAGRPGGFTPAALPGVALSPVVSLMRSAGGLWQNAGKTVPAVADSDPVRVAVCSFTGAEFVAASDAARPVLFAEGSGKWSLSFDGTDDAIAAPVIGPTMDNYHALVGVRHAVADARAFFQFDGLNALLITGPARIVQYGTVENLQDGPPAAGVWERWAAQRSAGATRFWLGGVAQPLTNRAATPVGGMNTLTISPAGRVSGWYAGTALSDADASRLASFLGAYTP